LKDELYMNVDSTIENLSQHMRPMGQGFIMGGFPKGLYKNMLAKHRFSDYSKA